MFCVGVGVGLPQTETTQPIVSKCMFFFLFVFFFWGGGGCGGGGGGGGARLSNFFTKNPDLKKKFWGGVGGRGFGLGAIV